MKKNNQKKLVTQLRIPKDTARELKKAVSKTQFSQNQFIIIALIRFLNDFKRDLGTAL